MSGGAKNIYVTDCTFIGTDIGLRFKTTRGRGGIVENIYINNITMQDIRGRSHSLRYVLCSTGPHCARRRKKRTAESGNRAGNRSHAAVQNIYIKNVVANGAEKAIFVRGLPEMNVKNIVMKTW